MKNKALIFLDIDGTILPEGEKQISADVVELIANLKAKGHVPFICTGRNAGSALDIIEQTNIDSYITSNGQQVVIEGQNVYIDYFKKDDLEQIFTIINKYTPHIAVENRNGLNVENTKAGLKLLDLIIGHGFFHSQALNELPREEIFQVWAFGTKLEVDKVEKSLVGRVQMYRWGDQSLEIAPLNSGKGSGIKKAVNHYTENVITYGFGDGVNDFSMMEAVDVSIAMGNAVEELKQKCDYVTTKCTDRGVEKGLQHFEVI